MPPTTDDTVRAADWYGWAFGFIMLVVASLAGLAYAGLVDRVALLEQRGSPTIQIEISKLMARQDAMERRMADITTRYQRIEDAWRDTSGYVSDGTLEGLQQRMDRLERAWTAR